MQQLTLPKITFFLVYLVFLNKPLVSEAQDSLTYPEYVYELSKFIQFPSTQYNETGAGEFFLELCKQKGLHTEILYTKDSSFNFTASIYPLSLRKPNIVLINHLDVVNPGDTSLWKFPPFSGVISDNQVWGRGAIDNKGMAIAELHAVADFWKTHKGEDLPYNVTILSVSDEEMGGHRGSIVIAENYLEQLNPVLMMGEGGSGVRGLLVSDPDRAVFGTSSVEKSKLVLKLELEIESSGHGSIPPAQYASKEMVIALEKLLTRKQEIIYTKVPVHSLKVLGKAEKGIRGFVLSHFTFFAFKPIVKKEIKADPMISSFFTNTITLTNLSAFQTDHNQISNKIYAVLDCRLIPETEPKQFLRQVRRRLNDKRIKITVLHEENAGERTLVPEVYVALCKSLKEVFPGALNLEIIFPATTDNHLFRNKGIPVYGIFPAIFTEDELRSIHAVNERIHIDALTNAIRVYRSFLERMMDITPFPSAPEKKKNKPNPVAVED